MAESIALSATGILAAAILFQIFLWRRYRRQRADAKTIVKPPLEGDYFRMLVTIPEIGVNIGDRGRIRFVETKNDHYYIVRITTRDGAEIVTTFLFAEAWQFELIR